MTMISFNYEKVAVIGNSVDCTSFFCRPPSSLVPSNPGFDPDSTDKISSNTDDSRSPTLLDASTSSNWTSNLMESDSGEWPLQKHYISVCSHKQITNIYIYIIVNEQFISTQIRMPILPCDTMAITSHIFPLIVLI